MHDFLIKDSAIEKYLGEGGDVIIPDGVTSIDDNAFDNCRSIRSITIPDSITSIGNSAFRGCRGLVSITIPDSVISIGDSAFRECVALPEEYLPIYKWASNRGMLKGYPNLTEFTIPNGLTHIADWAFEACAGLKKITIPDSVTSIGSCAFEYCLNLTSITLPDSITSIDDWVFRGCRSLMSITIPYSVKRIGSWAFSGCGSLSSITIPDSVTRIGSGAFEYCRGLEAITIPDSVTSIADNAENTLVGYNSIREFHVSSIILTVNNVELKQIAAITFCVNPNSYSDKCREKYSEYVSNQRTKLIPIIIKQDNAEAIFFCCEGIGTQLDLEALDNFIELANKRKKHRCLAYLLNYKNSAYTKEQIELYEEMLIERELNAI